MTPANRFSVRDRSWPMATLLLLAVLVPTGCVIWFMNEAMTGQTTAARQSVLEAYRDQLRFIRRAVHTHWQQKATELDRLVERDPAASFQALVTTGAADAAVLLDRRGRVVYPPPGVVPTPGRPTYEAEQLAAQFLAAEVPQADQMGLRSSRVPGVWQMASPNGRVIGLYLEETVHTSMHRFIDDRQSEMVLFALFSPTEGAYDEALSIGPLLPGWQASFMLLDTAALDQTARARVASYFWIGLLAIGTIAIVALGIGHTFRRQTRLARLKTDLVAAVSHELRTPLASMRLLVDGLLRDPEIDPKKTREYLDLIAAENGRLSRLIENFLTFSRLERNRHQFAFAATTPDEIVQTAVEAMRDRLYPGCTIHVDIEPDLPSLRADRDALVTALLNLLDNAYKYTPADKRIAVRAFREHGDIVFTVEDNGIGIPVSEQKRIFRRFYRVDRMLSRETSGVGLGLSIVHDVVRAHGGTVRVISASGEGTTFTMRVPWRQELTA